MAVHELFAYLCVHNAAAAIDYYVRALDARETVRLTEPGGRIGHAELALGGVTLMLSDEFPEFGLRSPSGSGTSSMTIHLHVDDADATIARAIAAGASLESPPRDHFYGERSGTIRDPFGHRWTIAHGIESVSPAEMQRRYTTLLEGSRPTA